MKNLTLFTVLTLSTISCTKTVRVPVPMKVEVPVKVEVIPEGSDWFCFIIDSDDNKKDGMMCFFDRDKCLSSFNLLKEAAEEDKDVTLKDQCKKGTFIKN